MLRYFEKLVDPYVPYKEHDRPPTRLWPFIWDYCQPFKRVFLITGIFTMGAAFIEVWLISYLGYLVDVLSTADRATFWADHGSEMVFLTVALLVLFPAINLVSVALLNNGILPNLGTLIRWRAHSHVLRQSVGWFENDFAGRIANRIMQTPPAAGEAAFQVFDAMAYSAAYVLGALILLSGSDPRLMIPLVIWLIGYGALVYWTVTRIGPASQAASDARSQVTGRVVDSYTNIHSVKMFAHNDAERDYAKEAIEHSRRTFQVEMRIYTLMDVMLNFLNGFLIVAVVGWAIYLWVVGQASVGVVAAASALVFRLNAMTGWIMWALSTFFQNLGVIKEGMETIAQPIELVDAPQAEPLVLKEGKIELQDISHHYGRGSGGLDRIDLTVAPGEKIGLIGRSGAGKSTLVKLLLRFYDTERGRVLIDGQDISQVTQNSLRSAIGMVQQDSSLMHRSVRDNIRYGMPNATDEQVIEAARKAEAHDFILGLQDSQGRQGYEAQVGERGVKLSGGQRQRIALARVILKDAPILILDEATSALDSEVEAEIQQTLYGMMQGKTVIAIAHRLSTIARMDRILVIDDGRIVEEGTHSALLAQGGLYARFWDRQSGGFIDTTIEAAE